MAFFKNLKNLFTGGSESASKKRRVLHNVKVGIDPESIWDLQGELGDGAFGKVYKVSSADQEASFPRMSCYPVRSPCVYQKG